MEAVDLARKEVIKTESSGLPERKLLLEIAV